MLNGLGRSYKDLNVRYVKGTDRCSTSELAYVEPGGHVPDVWFLPSEVWEIRGAGTLFPGLLWLLVC